MPHVPSSGSHGSGKSGGTRLERAPRMLCDRAHAEIFTVDLSYLALRRLVLCVLIKRSPHLPKQ